MQGTAGNQRVDGQIGTDDGDGLRRAIAGSAALMHRAGSIGDDLQQPIPRRHIRHRDADLIRHRTADRNLAVAALAGQIIGLARIVGIDELEIFLFVAVQCRRAVVRDRIADLHRAAGDPGRGCRDAADREARQELR